jgi:ethanolamine ammonia-lyase small subunit
MKNPVDVAILARLDELESAAKQALAASGTADRWEVGERCNCQCCMRIVVVKSLICDVDDRMADHIALNDPAHTLAVATAFRTILSMADEMDRTGMWRAGVRLRSALATAIGVFDQ